MPVISRLCRPLAGLVWLAGVALGTPALGDECRLSLSQSSVDFGQFNRSVQSTPATQYPVGEQHLSLTLACDHVTDMSLFYNAVSNGAERFRFAEHGEYALRLRNGVLDGQAVELGVIAGQGQPPGEIAAQLAWRPTVGVVPVRAGAPVQGKTFSVQLDISAWAEEPALRVRDALVWEASGVFEASAGAASRELQLRATFAPTACELSLSGGGVVDFGRISRNDLNSGQSTRLPSKSLMLNLGCDAPTRFALRMQDNRDGSATVNSEIYYGLGLDQSANRIGLYSLVFDPTDASADSFPRLYRTDSTTAGVAWSLSNASPLPVGANSYLGFSPIGGSQAGPVAIQHLSSRVTVEAVIAPTNTLDLSSDVVLDGSATLEIIYL
ncbi:DUF1120 domain-containing protein [Pseudomonas marginalis]|uniref:DUF1120 domain-containing protein n=1 Tax=Pseudomonas marginalis TaxID=298 RepID=A0A9X5QIA7_PSEMA|nr:DUF1120 domain-containing protein [Pseudomonas marginalis]OAJ46765.1 hypothetical protein AO064_20745 [Pseudomonas marginalis]